MAWILHRRAAEVTGGISGFFVEYLCNFLRRNERGKGAQFPGRRIIMERRITAGMPKSPNNVTSTFFSQIICSRKASGRTWRRQSGFLHRAPSNLVTILVISMPAPCDFSAWSCVYFANAVIKLFPHSSYFRDHEALRVIRGSIKNWMLAVFFSYIRRIKWRET